MTTIKMIIFVFSALAVVSVLGYGHQEEHHGPAHYKFEYGVQDPHTGDKKQQYEVRDGDVVKGAYSLADADGTLRVVEYTAGPHSGFNAVVKKIGHAHHPEHYHQHHSGGANYGHGGLGHGGAHSHVGVTHFGYQH